MVDTTSGKRRAARPGIVFLSKRNSIMALAVVVIAALVAGSVWCEEGGIRRYSFTERRELTWEEGKPLAVRESGGTIYVRGWNKKEIKVKAVKTAYAPDLSLARRNAGLLDISIEAPHDSVSIRTINPTLRTGDFRSYVDYSLDVPREINLDLKTVEGAIYVTGLKGEVTARTASGTITLREISGRSSAESGTGDIVLTDCENLASAKAASASITFEIKEKPPAADVELSNERGNISVTFPEDTSLLLDISAGPGMIVSSEAKVTVSSETEGEREAAGDAVENRKYYSGGGGVRIRISTVSGKVIIKTTPALMEEGGRGKNYRLR